MTDRHRRVSLITMATTTYVTEIVIRDVKKTQVTNTLTDNIRNSKDSRFSAVTGMESVVGESCVAR